MSKRQQPQHDKKCQLKATHGSSSIPYTGNFAAGSKTTIYTVTLKTNCPYRLQPHERKLKVKTEHVIQCPEISDLGLAWGGD